MVNLKSLCEPPVNAVPYTGGLEVAGSNPVTPIRLQRIEQQWPTRQTGFENVKKDTRTKPNYRRLIANSGTFLFFVFSILFPVCVPAGEIEIQPLNDGVALSLNGQYTELRVATPHSFRFHVSSPLSPVHEPDTIFLNATIQAVTPFT